ncbi:MAG: radical SAM protein, partial [Actinobacteria bacterium]|nr:radical SAM protein [Actinomycetota bacterium]
PALGSLLDHARDEELDIEVFSNLVRVGADLWERFRRPGVRLATSYYAPRAREHEAITRGKGSHGKTLANIRRAIEEGIPLRVGIIAVREGQAVEAAAAQLRDLGVDDVGFDGVREIGRGLQGRTPDTSSLCGRCVDGVLAISPEGEAWPCVFSRWISLGNVRRSSLRDIYEGRAARQARDELGSRFAQRRSSADGSCRPQCQPTCSPRCSPTCNPIACGPRACWPAFS